MKRVLPLSFMITLAYTLLVLLRVAQGDTIYGWGKNDNGQLGLGSTASTVYDITPIPFYDTLSITSISVGENTHFAAAGGNYYSCGSNSNGQLGLGTQVASYSTPTSMPALSGEIYTIYSLPRATIAYSSSRKTIIGCGFAAGYVRGLSFGNYYRFQTILPEFLGGQIEKIYTANGACFIQLSDGTIQTAGISSSGVFGLGSSVSVPTYTKMDFWSTHGISLSKIFTTQAASVCAQSVNQSLYCWGNNDVGQLGLNHTNNNVFTPTLVPFFDVHGYRISQLEQGIMHTIVLTCGGRVFAWGDNRRGQLGIGSLLAQSAPTEIIFLRDKKIIEIVAGAYHNFARTEGNDWFFWGATDSGVSALDIQLNDILSPTLSPQIKARGINHIESGAYSNFAIGWNKIGAPVQPQSCPADWNINECQSTNSPCGPNMDCLDTERSYICSCKSGYALVPNNTNACEDINECLRNPCIRQASCNNTEGSFSCDCPLGFEGDGLPKPQGNECIPAVCGNGIVESGEECDTHASPSCCDSSCKLRPANYICRNTTVVCDKTEYCDGILQFCPDNDWINGSFCDYCGNGQCNNGTETCTNCQEDCGSCSSCVDILCNGACVKSPIDCIVKCKSGEFACASGVCVSDFTSCATGNCSTNMVECWDGSCANKTKLCPLIPSCPLLTKRCFGKCIGANQVCQVAVAENCTTKTDEVCLDGNCADECAQYNGCSTGFIRCPSGECTTDIAICKGDCKDDLYKCADKTCNLPDNCTVLLRFEAAIPFSQNIPSTVNSTVSVLSTSGIPIVSLQLLTGTFRNTTPVDVSATSFSSLKQVDLPEYWNGTKLEDNIFSSAVAFTVPERTRFTKSITVSFEGAMPENMNLTDLCLGYINSSGLWDCASDVQYVNGTFIGNTSHFTPFAVIRKIKAPKFNALGRDDLNVFKNISVNSVIIYVYCGLLIVFTILFVWAFHADREEKKQKNHEDELTTGEYVYKEEPRTPPTTRKSITVFRAETPPVPSNVLSTSPISPSPRYSAPLMGSSQSVESPNSSRPSSVALPAPPTAPSSPVFPSPPTVPSSPALPSPALSSSTFADGEMSVAPPESERPRRQRARTVVMKEAAQARFTTKHKWLSIYFTARIENLPRVSRVTILLCMILTNMTVAAVFYNSENRSSVGQRILVGVISSLISFVCSFGIFMMFKLTNKKYRAACYAFSLLWILGTGFLTLWYNLKLEQDAAYGWCVSASIGIIQDALLNEPIKIIVISLLIAFCPFIPFVNKL